MTGRSIPVVHTIRVRVDRVRFSAARPPGAPPAQLSATFFYTGCSIPVVRKHGVLVDRVRFSAARQYFAFI